MSRLQPTESGNPAAWDFGLGFGSNRTIFGSLPKDYSSIDLRYYLESIGINILEGTLFYYNIKSENEFRISIAHMLEKDIEKNLDKLNIGIRDFLNDEKNKMKYKIPNI